MKDMDAVEADIVVKSASLEALGVSTQCPICKQHMIEPFMTKCGHSFCYNCIKQHLVVSKSCPIPECRQQITRSDIFPNFMLNKLLTATAQDETAQRARVASLAVDLLRETGGLGLSDVNTLIATLMEKRRVMQSESQRQDQLVCAGFLRKALRQREHAKEKIEAEMATLQSDLQRLQQRLEQGEEEYGVGVESSSMSKPGDLAKAGDKRRRMKSADGTAEDNTMASASTGINSHSGSNTGLDSTTRRSGVLSSWPEEDIYTDARSIPSEQRPVGTDSGAGGIDGEVSSAAAALSPMSEALQHKTHRVQSHFEDLQKAYFEDHLLHEGEPGKALNSFTGFLHKFSRFSAFRIFSKLKYGGLQVQNSIVSSIEFDRDSNYFATAGVSKRIKIFDYKTVVELPNVEFHPPICEMKCRSKISCVSWNPYLQEHIASSDYEGVISLWDVSTGKRLKAYEEHEKRAWSVDFSPSKPTILASGSDDSKVKIWSVEQEHSVATIDSKANVCCVKFNPESSNYIAFGSADHFIHYYDLRNLSKGVFKYRGHGKAVSYVRFLSATELVSASTDSTLKLWNTTLNECKCTFTGHQNEKNFVGLTINDDYIACGSENNAVYVYYKAFTKPVVVHKFSNRKEGEDNNFVSSVCWKQDSNVLLAANSLGVISMMQLV